MTEVIHGKLIWQSIKQGKTGKVKKERRIIFPTKKGMSQPTFFNPDQIATSLFDRPDEELEVALELDGGKPVCIRPVGEDWKAPSSSITLQDSRNKPRDQTSRRQQDQTRFQNQHSPSHEKESSMPDFHNPYNFVPALPRTKVTNELGDHKPVGHHRYFEDRISGTIRVKMTTKTPLLLPDAANAFEYNNDDNNFGVKKGHKTFPVRVDAEGNPYLPPTSLKGMLRSAYEAVTNSRLGVFGKHNKRLGFRLPVDDGLRMVPARIVKIDSNNFVTIQVFKTL